jgi:cytochrome c553
MSVISSDASIPVPIMTRSTTTATLPGKHRVTAAGLRAAVPAAVLAIALAAGAGLDAANAAGGARNDVQAKIAYCMDCHGPAAQGYRGYFPIPRLAGQQPEYLENQLRAFIERRRANSIMFSVAHVLSPGMISALAEHFRNLHPRALGGGPRNLIAAGRKIFEDGIPDANVAACAACHGPGAVGNGQVPRLAGQLYPYVVKELTNWSKERGQNPSKPDPALIMEPVAHSLTRSQVDAVAAYVSSLD